MTAPLNARSLKEAARLLAEQDAERRRDVWQLASEADEMTVDMADRTDPLTDDVWALHSAGYLQLVNLGDGRARCIATIPLMRMTDRTELTLRRRADRIEREVS